MLYDIETYLSSADLDEKIRISNVYIDLYAFVRGGGRVEIEDMLRPLPQSICARYGLPSNTPPAPIE